jgi:hypothetical protein
VAGIVYQDNGRIRAIEVCHREQPFPARWAAGHNDSISANCRALLFVINSRDTG